MWCGGIAAALGWFARSGVLPSWAWAVIALQCLGLLILTIEFLNYPAALGIGTAFAILGLGLSTYWLFSGGNEVMAWFQAGAICVVAALNVSAALYNFRR